MRFNSSYLRPADPRRGVALLWVVLVALTLIGLTGLAIDMSYIVTVRQQLQTGGDAAALAGAAEVRFNEDLARAVTRQVAAANHAARRGISLDLNGSNNSTGDIVVGRYNRDTQTFTPQTEEMNAVMVRARRWANHPSGALDLAFGPIFGVRTVDLDTVSIAMAGGTADAGILVLDPHAEPAFLVHGGVDITINGADVQINSDGSPASEVSGSATITAQNFNMVGSFDPNGTSAELNTDLNIFERPL